MTNWKEKYEAAMLAQGHLINESLRRMMELRKLNDAITRRNARIDRLKRRLAKNKPILKVPLNEQRYEVYSSSPRTVWIVNEGGEGMEIPAGMLYNVIDELFKEHF